MSPDNSDKLDKVMEQASQALAQMDYLTCEDLCLQTLTLAAAQRNWAYYARVLLPLQEARRQRRLIAAEGVIRLGTSDLVGDPVRWLRQLAPGCVVLTAPHDRPIARRLTKAVRRQRLYVEVLLAEAPPRCPDWTLMSVDGIQVSCVVPAPPSQWTNRWLESAKSSDEAGPSESSPGPADWFLDACEALGDAALGQVHVPLGKPMRVMRLERCLEVVTDHEILHQALADAAKALI